MSVHLSAIGNAFQFFNSNGRPLSLGKLYTYAAGTSTPQTTYTDNTGIPANTNPIQLDPSGRLPNEVWLTDATAYKFVLQDAVGNTIGTYDNIVGINDPTGLVTFEAALAASGGSALVGYSPSGGSARTVQSRLRDVISVKDFGAIGNGVADDTTAIQAAIDYVFGLGGGAIYFPRGIYVISTITLKASVRLYGDPMQPSSVTDGVVLKGSGAGTMVDTPVGSTFACGMRGFFFQGAGATNIGLRLRNVVGGQFLDLFFANFQDNALLEDDGIENTFERIAGFNCVLNRARAAKIGAFDIAGTDHRVSNVEFTTSQSVRSDANLYLCAIAIRGANHFCNMIIGHDADVGIHMAAAETRLSQGRAMSNFGPGFDLSVGGSSQYVACYARGNSTFAANTYSGYFLGTSQANTLIGCRAAVGSQKYGFEDTGSFTSVESRNYYYGCRSQDHATAAFSINGVSGKASTPVFSPMMLLATAADATPSVEQTDLLNLTLNGAPVTVTNFTKGVHGQTVRVLGNVNVTIQNNATIATNTGADKVLAANKFYRFTLNNTVWIEDA